MAKNEVEVFGAFSIDNSTLKSNGYKFNEGLLKQLIQFSNSPIQMIFSDVIHNEAKKHLAINISGAKSNVERAIKSAKKHLQIPEKQIAIAQKALTLDCEASDLAEGRLREYYERLNAEIVSSGEYLDTDILMEKYFKTQAPFEVKKEKKNEFPDAIALISLEAWAKENETKILVVSNDKGWKGFSEQSRWIFVKDNLAEAIAEVQPENQVDTIIENLHRNGALEKGSVFAKLIKEAIEKSLDGSGIDIEASSHLYFEYDDVEVFYIDHDFVLDEAGRIKVNIIGIESDQIMLTVDVIIKCDVSATFDFSVWDSIDREYVGLIGGNHFSVEEEYDSEILVELNGDFKQGYMNMEVGEITVLTEIGYANFGEIEPDYHESDI